LLPFTHAIYYFFLYSHPHHPYLHSFPTRRSSDLLARSRRTLDGNVFTLANGEMHVGKGVGFEVVRVEDLLDPLQCDHRLCFLGRSEGTRLNSSHSQISYAVFCLKKKKI